MAEHVEVAYCPVDERLTVAGHRGQHARNGRARSDGADRGSGVQDARDTGDDVGGGDLHGDAGVFEPVVAEVAFEQLLEAGPGEHRGLGATRGRPPSERIEGEDVLAS